MRTAILIVASMLTSIALGCKAGRIPTVEMPLESIGTRAKAEFYPVQGEPQSGNGRFVPRRNSAEVVYAVPTRLLGASEIAVVDVVAVAPRSARKRVEITLTPGGLAKVKTFMASAPPDASLVLVWGNEAHYIYPASRLDTSGIIVVADDLDPAFADSLRAALR